MPLNGSRRARAKTALAARVRLPRLRDRLTLGSTGLRVSPFCLGVVGQPEVVTAAYEAGINFFFLSADMHWPVYEPLRQGLRRLLKASPSARKRVVVAVASYVTQPEFCYVPFLEVLEAVPELGHVDVAVIGGSYASDFSVRLAQYRKTRPGQMRALGASFHDRRAALRAVDMELLDIAFVRYNARHDAAEAQMFRKLRGERNTLLWNFQSTHGFVPHARLAALGLPAHNWRPDITDHYRFALRVPQLDGVLCSLDRKEHVAALVSALKKGPLSPEQATYLKRLSALDAGTIALT
jgi:hypothetical protein